MILDEAKNIRGAVYIPAGAFNAYQAWRDYDATIAKRDLAYAAKLKLNALRVFLNYDYFLQDRKRLENSFYNLLQSASAHKIRIMPVLFECRGAEPTDEAKNDRSAETAGWMRSPSSELVNASGRWYEIAEFVNWFMQRWSHEPRVLALEVINEPRTANEFKFARSMFSATARHRRSLPLTFGAAEIEDSRLLADLGLDVLQSHEKPGQTDEALRKGLRGAAVTQEILSRPVLLTEWHGPYESTAPLVREHALGNFFWSLMLRPTEQLHGAIGGVFHEDGAVRSLADAREISGDAGFTAEERPRVKTQ